MEHSDRGRYVTDQVLTWICNDSEQIEQAQSAARRSTGVFTQWASGVIRTARPHMAAWHVRQELAPNDYNRVDWQAVADALKPEGDDA
jgi:hypothetical protein